MQSTTRHSAVGSRQSAARSPRKRATNGRPAASKRRTSGPKWRTKQRLAAQHYNFGRPGDFSAERQVKSLEPIFLGRRASSNRKPIIFALGVRSFACSQSFGRSVVRSAGGDGGSSSVPLARLATRVVSALIFERRAALHKHSKRQHPECRLLPPVASCLRASDCETRKPSMGQQLPNSLSVEPAEQSGGGGERARLRNSSL